MSQGLTEEGIMQWIKTLPKKKGEKPTIRLPITPGSKDSVDVQRPETAAQLKTLRTVMEPKEKSRDDHTDELRDKVAFYFKKAEDADVGGEAEKAYLKLAKNFQRRLEELLYREEDPEKVRALLAQWENDKSLPDSVRQTMIAKIRARLGEKAGPEQGYAETKPRAMDEKAFEQDFLKDQGRPPSPEEKERARQYGYWR